MKGSFLVAVLSVLVLQAAADFGPFSAYGPCMCDEREYRSRVCEAEPCVGDYVESRPCDCVPLVPSVACPMVAGADSVYGIVADPCDCQNYYQCEYNTTSQAFIAYQRSCNPCELWDQGLLTCIRDESKVNCTFAPSTEGIGICPLLEVEGNDRQFILGNETMDCAPGTMFNLTLCTCVHFAPSFPMLKGITCVTFDDGIKASQGLWLYNENVVVSDNACMSGTCGFFNSSAQSKLEIAYFSNAFDNFETFSVSFFFKRTAGASGEQSLLDNSECSDDGSMFVRSVSGTVLGSATNSTGDSVNVNYLVSDDAWHQYAMSFDGSKVTFYVDGALQQQKDLGGRLNRVKAPMVFGGCVCGGSCFFDGYMDTVSFVHGVLDAASVSHLYSNPASCLPPTGP
ncbi:hypothetical protein LSAT2_009748 [Lamellibrachia satsuma]|nr:hypothetical protein LSAT2_009748 [Lamellibrachia satsuma]